MIVGYTAGAFDLFHIGHLNILRNAKSMCDKLVVGITTDNLIVSTKEKAPFFTFEERIEIVRNIKYVDLAIEQDDLDKFKAWQKIKYDVLFSGDDWYQNNRWNKYEEKLKEVGVKIIYFPYTKKVSSTLIINSFKKQ